jgi:hypothetical protein
MTAVKFLAVSTLCAVAAFADYVNLKELTPEEKAQIEQALPKSAPAKPKKARKILVVHMTRRDGKPSGGHQSIMWANHFLTETGKRTGAFDVTVQNDESAFEADNLKKYDAIIFNNTVGVLFEDPTLRQNLLDFVKNGKGFVGFHAAGATFVQYPKYDQFPEFGVMLGGYEDGGHPWSPKDTTYVKIDDPQKPAYSDVQRPVRDQRRSLPVPRAHHARSSARAAEHRRQQDGHHAQDPEATPRRHGLPGQLD